METAAQMDLKADDIISGRYRAGRRIGAGSFGEVWVGQDIETGERVALKKLHDAVQSDDIAVRFRREAYFLARVQSEHVARIIDFVPDDGGVLVMQFVEGTPLSEVVQQRTLSVEEAIALGVDLLSGVRDLHAARVLHRDLKPGNVILHPTKDGGTRAVIVDFGLGRMTGVGGEDERTGSSMTELTRSNVVLGTLPYMSPEQILNSRQVTQQSDVYSVGAILYRAVAGVHAFPSDDPREIANAKLKQNPPKLDTGRSDPMARGLEEAVDKALMRLPQDRHKDAVEMLDALARLRDAAPREDTDSHPTLRVALAADGELARPADTDRKLESSGTTTSHPMPVVSRAVAAPTDSGVVPASSSAPATVVAPAPATPKKGSPITFIALALVLFASGMGAGALLVRRSVQRSESTNPTASESTISSLAALPIVDAAPDVAVGPPLAAAMELPVEPDAGTVATTSSATAATAATTGTGESVTTATTARPTTTRAPTASATASAQPLPVRIESIPSWSDDSD